MTANPSPGATPDASTSAKQIGRIVARTLFYFILLVAIMILWDGRGLFIYENF